MTEQVINRRNTMSYLLKLKCKTCGKYIDITEGELPIENTESQERKMGGENTYSGQTEHECECGNEINVNAALYEYPVGTENYREIDVDGAEIIDDNICLENYLPDETAGLDADDFYPEGEPDDSVEDFYGDS